MVSAENQEQNEAYTFKDMLLQPEHSYLILATIKEVEAHEVRSHFALMKKSEVKNKRKKKDWKLKKILSILSYKVKRFPDGIILKHKARLCANGQTQQWGGNYLGTYAPVLNRIKTRSLLDMESIHEFTSISIDCLSAFTQADLDADVFMDIVLGMGVGENR